MEENLTRADGRTDGRRRVASGDSRNYFSPKCFHTDANRARTGNNMARHLRFVSRTVMVQQSNVDAAYKTLNRYSFILTKDTAICSDLLINNTLI